MLVCTAIPQFDGRAGGTRGTAAEPFEGSELPGLWSSAFRLADPTSRALPGTVWLAAGARTSIANELTEVARDGDDLLKRVQEAGGMTTTMHKRYNRRTKDTKTTPGGSWTD